MIRIVTKVAPPQFFLLCDTRSCNFLQIQEIDLTATPERRNQEMAAYAQARQMEGWLFTLTAQICPECMKEEKEAREGKPLIQPATLTDQQKMEKAAGVANGKLAGGKLVKPS